MMLSILLSSLSASSLSLALSYISSTYPSVRILSPFLSSSLIPTLSLLVGLSPSLAVRPYVLATLSRPRPPPHPTAHSPSLTSSPRLARTSMPSLARLFDDAPPCRRRSPLPESSDLKAAVAFGLREPANPSSDGGKRWRYTHEGVRACRRRAEGGEGGGGEGGGQRASGRALHVPTRAPTAAAMRFTRRWVRLEVTGRALRP
mmetsp:Transcript_18260/g.55063  ORF Transcript_18260/g.55063 Transcript_18260/m.55063 type:complete len:203 (-) Transcript_18260:3860-4468(-)